MSTSQTRVAAGVPTGGQFAASQRAESDLTLEDLTDAYLGEVDSTPEEIDEVRRTIDLAYDSARHWESRKGVRERSRGVIDVDDMAQEAALSILEREANGHVIKDKKGYMHTYAWGIAQQAGNHGVRQEDRKALKMFRTECSEREATLGRSLTRSEEDQIADDIRANWHDQRRKPTVNFRRFQGQMEVSMDAQESTDAVGYLLPNSVLGRPGEETTEVAPGSYTDRALAAVEGHEGDLRDARRMLWNALAEMSDNDVPMVRAGTMSQRKVTAARATLAQHPGGVLGAARDWENGQSNAATEALLAPWGERSVDERQSVIDQMRRHPERAEDLWDSALKLANNRNADRV